MKHNEYEWITVCEQPSVIDNQHPAQVSPLFRQWTAAGWEIKSVNVFETTLSTCMCKAIGVLRRPVQRTSG